MGSGGGGCAGGEERMWAVHMWAVGAVGVLEERNACGRWVWGEGGQRACGARGEV